MAISGFLPRIHSIPPDSFKNFLTSGSRFNRHAGQVVTTPVTSALTTDTERRRTQQSKTNSEGLIVKQVLSQKRKDDRYDVVLKALIDVHR